MKFSNRISEVKPSATLAITSKAKSMLAEGEDVIILAAGEPDFDTPEQIKKAAITAIGAGKTKYTPSGGTVSLKKAIAHKLKRDNALDYGTDQIVVSCGAKHALFNILQVVCEDASEVVIVPPYWVSYPEMVRLAGGRPRYASCGDGLRVPVERIIESLDPGVKALILNSPSNPAGMVYSREELEELAGACVAKGILIISDEIYEKIVFDGMEHVSIAAVSPEAKDITVVVNGVSKSHSMTGWRVGYMAGPAELAKKVNILQSHSTSNPCSISQAASECALSDDMQPMTTGFRDMFQARRDLLLGLFEGNTKVVPYKGQGAFYMFCDISRTGLGSVAFAERLLQDKKVAVIPGEPFGRDDYVRLSFAASEETLREGVTRMLDWVDGL